MLNKPIKYTNLVDIDKLQTLMDSLHQAFGISNSIIDTDGIIIITSGWLDACINFHRVNPQACANCTESDTSLARSMLNDEAFAIYNCLNGLMEAVIPIIIGGQHLANVFAGQFFMESPDLEFFRQQARQFGFEEKSYLEAIAKVPVIPRQRVDTISKVYAEMTQTLAINGLDRLHKQRLEEELLILNSVLAQNIGRTVGGQNVPLHSEKQALADSEAQLAMAGVAINHAYDALYINDDHFRFLYVNDTACRALGYSREELLRMSVTEIDPNVNQVAAEQIKQQILTLGHLTFETHHKRKNGEIFPIELISTIINFEGKNVCISLGRDITTRKKTEDELRAAKDGAEQASRAKSAFLAAVSHDLRQPLTSLSLGIDILESKLASTDSNLSANMKHCVTDLSSMLSRLVDISMLEAGAIKPNVSDFAVELIFKHILSSYTPKAGAKKLKLRSSHIDLIGRTDPLLFQRIVGNLVDNAIRYTEQGGVLIGSRRRQGKRWIEVWDTGIGIPSDKISEIFEEYHQLGNSEQNQEKGTGLGLSIVAKTAALLNLEVYVRSWPGKGSLFAVELPLGERL